MVPICTNNGWHHPWAKPIDTGQVLSKLEFAVGELKTFWAFTQSDCSAIGWLPSSLFIGNSSTVECDFLDSNDPQKCDLVQRSILEVIISYTWWKHMKTITTHLIHLLELPHGDLTVCYGKLCFKTIAKSSNEVGHGFRKYVQSRPIVTPMLLHRDVLMNIKYMYIYISIFLYIYVYIYDINDVIQYLVSRSTISRGSWAHSSLGFETTGHRHRGKHGTWGRLGCEVTVVGFVQWNGV